MNEQSTWKWRFAAAGAAMLALLLLGGIGTAESAVPANIRIGLVGSLFRDTPEPTVQVMMRPFKSLMESQTGISGQLVAAGDPCELGKQLADGKLQLGVLHGFEFAWARQKYSNLKPLVIIVNQKRHLHAHLVVSKDCNATALADLQGKSLAVARRTREHCLLFVERRCQACGKDFKQFFARVTAPADAEDALDDVVDGIVDAALVDGLALERFQQAKPKRFEKLRSLQQSETFPAAVVAYCSGGLSDEVLRRFREGMINANQTPRGQQLLRLCRMTGFEPVPDDYEQTLAKILECYPPPDESK